MDMTRLFQFLKKQPVFAAVLALAVAVPALLLPQDVYWHRCVLRILMCGTMLFLLYLVSGEKTLSQGCNQTGYVIGHLLAFPIMALLMGAMGFIGQLQEGVESGLPLRLVTIVFMVLFACLFEELCFRALLNDAIVGQFRNCRGVFAVSATVSSLVFGLVHVMGSPVSTAFEFAQAALKTFSCAIFGFAMMILYWKTRNVWALGIIHALYDLFTMSSVILGGNAKLGVGSYVNEGEQGFYGIIVLAVESAVSLIITLIIWKKVGRTLDFKSMRENW